jgi:hypothetical protein
MLPLSYVKPSVEASKVGNRQTAISAKETAFPGLTVTQFGEGERQEKATSDKE